ncbi:MAG: tetratricopeptide repeat protein [Sandaracinaceae bacterium]
MGTRLLRWGRAELAIPPLAHAVQLDPSHAETWNALAMARYHAGEVEAAQATFREGLRRHPTHDGLRLGLAAVLINAHELEDALAIYGELVHDRPQFAPAHVGRALLLHELGREDEAEDAFETAVRVARDPRPYQQRLEAYRALRAEAHRDL